MKTITQKPLSVIDTARRLEFTLKYILDLIYAGKLDAQKINGKWAISAESVEAWRNGRRDARLSKSRCPTCPNGSRKGQPRPANRTPLS